MRLVRRLTLKISAHDPRLRFRVDQRQFSALVRSTRQALLRTYGRCFAEFLNEESPVRLGLLDLPTCVGFGTDALYLILEAFLGSLLGRISQPVGRLFYFS